MYKFSEATDRVKRMRQMIRDRVVRYDADRGEIYTEASKKYEHVVPIIKRPLCFKEVCEKVPVFIEDTELIVGGRGPSIFSSPMFPEWGMTDWVVEEVEAGNWHMEDDGLWHNPDEDECRMSISPEDYERMKNVREYWKDRKVGTMADAWKPDFYEELSRLGVSSYVEGGMSVVGLPIGHVVAGYHTIINTGFGAIRKQAQDWLDEHYGNLMGEDINKNMFYESVVITCDGAMTLVNRYAAKAAEMSRDEKFSKERRDELAMMADGLAWIAENPARTFWEACQLTMMYQLMLWLESRPPGPALGRFDFYTWPFLEKDLAEGRITMEYAQEIVDMFFLKANCYYGAGPAKLVSTTGIGNTYQHTTLGGVIPATGEDASNPVTYMVLETVGRLLLHDPTISLRIHKGTPDSVWECALAMTKLVGGLPLFQNDEVITPGLMREVGFELKDARDYAIIGCQEIVGCGTDWPAPNGCHPPHASIWWGSVLDMAINDGVNPLNGEQASLHTGLLTDMKSMDEVREAVRKMGHHIFRMFVSMNNYAESLSPFFGPQAIYSISIEGCMENGKDCTAGGAKYNSYGGTATGLATLADSLTTIKYMVFDKKLCTAEQLLEATRANWEGYEALRQQILNTVPHFGNADPYADEEMKWCADLYYEVCQECHSVRSKVYKSGLYGASDHVAQGHKTWGTPDGRKYPEPIADAASPAQGRDKLGPTSVFVSSCSYDHTKFLGGIALNMKMHPSVLANDDAVGKLRDLTKTYFANGGLEVQYNVVDADTLREAQITPENYRDLVVRIAGYSAYFVELGKELQDDIISRNELSV
jgi:formate C-acetyltransferase